MFLFAGLAIQFSVIGRLYDSVVAYRIAGVSAMLAACFTL